MSAELAFLPLCVSQRDTQRLTVCVRWSLRRQVPSARQRLLGKWIISQAGRVLVLSSFGLCESENFHKRTKLGPKLLAAQQRLTIYFLLDSLPVRDMVVSETWWCPWVKDIAMSACGRHLRANGCSLEMAGNARKNAEAGSLWEFRQSRSPRGEWPCPCCVRGDCCLTLPLLAGLDNRLCVFGQVEIKYIRGACISGEKIF